MEQRIECELWEHSIIKFYIFLSHQVLSHVDKNYHETNLYLKYPWERGALYDNVYKYFILDH